MDPRARVLGFVLLALLVLQVPRARVHRTALRHGITGEPIQVFVLEPPRPRYPDGAPVVVMVNPAARPVRARPADPLRLTYGGFIMITFGTDFRGFDYGGRNTKRAVRDVLMFAMGLEPDARGRYLGDLVGVPLAGIAGAVGWSHGGNAVVTTLEEYPDDLSHLSFYVSYESPCGTSPGSVGDSVLVDAGGVRHDPDPRRDGDGDGFEWDDGRNPYYSPDRGTDFSGLAWDGNATWYYRGRGGRPRRPGEAHAYGERIRGVLFIDGDGNGRFDPRDTLDLDGDGVVEPGEDFPFTFFEHEFGGVRKRVYSLAVTRACAELGVFGDGWPRFVATPEEAEGFWGERDMAYAFERMRGRFGDLMVIIVSGRRDHVQAQTDYPHIRAQYDGLRRRAGVGWVKINPSPAYIGALVDRFPLHLVRDLPPNEDVAPGDMWRYTLPVTPEGGKAMVAVAVCELADRVRAGERGPLAGPLFPDAPGPRIRFAPEWVLDRYLRGAVGG